MLVRALTEPVPPLPSHFPPEFNRVVLCAMARDPQRRYRDLKAFGAALVGIERQLGFQPTSAPLISEVDEEARDVQSHYEFGEELLPRHHEEIDSSVTILRSLPSARPAPETGLQSTGEPDAETGAEAPPSPSRLWIAAAGTVAALVVAIVAVVYSCGGPPTINGDPPPSTSVTPAVPVTPAGVTGLTGTLDGGSATFAWEPSKTASEHEVSYLLTPIGGSASRDDFSGSTLIYY